MGCELRHLQATTLATYERWPLNKLKERLNFHPNSRGRKAKIIAPHLRGDRTSRMRDERSRTLSGPT
ncbi:unnamed protein product [Amoebophrya sp. A120]|nr:unnamed protein product [Amoebophrya sp. A120]|eukprot:GSA120T00003542001.1